MNRKYKGNYSEKDRITRVKLYKAGKNWVSSLMNVIGLIKVFRKKDISEINFSNLDMSERKVSNRGSSEAAKTIAAIGALGRCCTYRWCCVSGPSLRNGSSIENS